MAVELPITFKVDGAGSLATELNKATAVATKAAKEQAAEQEKTAKYLDGLRQRYFTDQQRRLTAEVKAEEQAVTKQAAVAQRLEQALRAVQASVSGVSAEEQKLIALQEQANAAFLTGTINAKTYEQAQAAIQARTAQVRDEQKAQVQALQQFKGGANQAGESLGRLAAALSVVSPEAASAVGGLQKVEGVLGGASAAGEILGLSFAGIAAVAIPLAAAIGLVVYELREEKKAAEAAKVAEEALKAVRERSEKATKDFAEAIRDYQDRQAVATGVIDQLTAAHNRERQALQVKAKELYGADAAAVRLAEDNLKLAEKEGKAAKEVDGLRVALNAARQAQADHTAEIRTATSEFEITAAAELAAAKATRERAGDVRSATEATREAAALQALHLKLLIQEANAEQQRSAAFEKATDSLDKAHDAAVRAVATEQERIQLAAQAAREAAVSAAAEAQAKVSADAEGAYQRQKIAEKLRETLDLISQGEVADLQKANDQKVKDAKDAADKRAEAEEQAITGAISTVQSGLEGIASLIGGPIAGAIASLILNLQDTIDSLIEDLASLPDILKSAPDLIVSLVTTLLQEVVPALLSAVPDIVGGLIAAIPDLITAIIDAIPLIIVAFVESVPNLLQAIILGLPDIIVALIGLIPTLIGNFGSALMRLVQEAWAWITGDGISELIAAFLEGLWDAWSSFWDKATDLFDFSGKNKAKTKMGDTPGPTLWGDRGGPFSRDDWVMAAKTRDALQRQAGGNSQPMTATVDLSSGYLAFDGALRRATKNPRTLREIKGFTSARGLA